MYTHVHGREKYQASQTLSVETCSSTVRKPTSSSWGPLNS